MFYAVQGQLASVIVSTDPYKEGDANPDAKYAIACCKRGPNIVSAEKWIKWLFSNTYSINIFAF